MDGNKQGALEDSLKNINSKKTETSQQMYDMLIELKEWLENSHNYKKQEKKDVSSGIFEKPKAQNHKIQNQLKQLKDTEDLVKKQLDLLSDIDIESIQYKPLMKTRIDSISTLSLECAHKCDELKSQKQQQVKQITDIAPLTPPLTEGISSQIRSLPPKVVSQIDEDCLFQDDEIIDPLVGFQGMEILPTINEDNDLLKQSKSHIRDDNNEVMYEQDIQINSDSKLQKVDETKDNLDVLDDTKINNLDQFNESDEINDLNLENTTNYALNKEQ